MYYNKREWRQLGIFISVMITIGTGLPFILESKIYSWFDAGVFVLLWMSYALIGFHGFKSGRGRFATEFDLDDSLVYKIKEVVNLKDDVTLYVLAYSLDYQINVVRVSSFGLQKFAVINNSYLVSKEYKGELPI